MAEWCNGNMPGSLTGAVGSIPTSAPIFACCVCFYAFEVFVMYKDYVLFDPATQLPLFIFGGDDADEALQAVLDYFCGAAVDLSDYDAPLPVGRQCR